MSKILQLLQRLEAPSRNIFEMPKVEIAPLNVSSAVPAEEVEPEPSYDTQLIPIASGKGGVGKTNVAVNLSIALTDRFARMNGDGGVILVDCDFGLPNADILLNTKVSRSLDDFINRRVENLSDVVVPTGIPGLSFLSGASTPSATLSNLQYQHRQKFLRHIKSLKARFVVLDLGASVHFEVVDFFSMVNSGVVVTNPEPTALRDSYLFIRAVLHRKIRQEAKEWPRIIEFMDRLDAGDMPIPSIPGVLHEIQKQTHHVEHKTLQSILDAFEPKLVMNRSETFDEGVEAARKFKEEARRELGISVSYLGPVLHDPLVVKAVKESTPFIRRYPECDASHWVRNIAERIVENSDFEVEKNYFSFGTYLRRLFTGAPAAA